MRNAFADELTKLGNEDSRVVMLSGDIGNRLFDKFKDKHPSRFFNCGVAEANMMGVAAGMAMNGLRPVAYTITPFVTTRCLEQIRTDVCYHEAPVTIVAVGAGLAYSGLGPTHHACEDISFLRSIPNKLAGVVAMFSAIIVLVFLPWLDSAKTRSNKYRPLGKQFFWIFFVVCIGLGYLGAQPPEGVYVVLGRILTVLYFAYFLIVLPLLARIERPRPLPNSIADDVLAKSGRKAVATAVVGLVAALSLLAGSTGDARASEGQENPPSAKWSFAGPFGTFDRGAVQRGLKVYKEVCSNCHSLQYIAFRNLSEPGGPGYTPAQAAAFAAEYKIKDGPNDAGDMFERPGRPADYFPSPFPNEQAARAANGGAAPPDLSLIAKARSYKRGFPWFLIDFFTQFQEQGPNYVNALLQGYEETPPHGVTIPEGSYYNKYFPGHAIKMPPPLSDGQVTFDDGSPATVKQYAHDVATFLMWTAEPHMEARKRLGYQVFVFLIIFAGLMYFTKKRVWAAAH